MEAGFSSPSRHRPTCFRRAESGHRPADPRSLTRSDLRAAVTPLVRRSKPLSAPSTCRRARPTGWSTRSMRSGCRRCGSIAASARRRRRSSSIPRAPRRSPRVLRIANAARVPVVPWGGGSGTQGGALPIHGGIILDLKRLNQILEIDEKSLYVRAAGRRQRRPARMGAERSRPDAAALSGLGQLRDARRLSRAARLRHDQHEVRQGRRSRDEHRGGAADRRDRPHAGRAEPRLRSRLHAALPRLGRHLRRHHRSDDADHAAAGDAAVPRAAVQGRRRPASKPAGG